MQAALQQKEMLSEPQAPIPHVQDQVVAVNDWEIAAPRNQAVQVRCLYFSLWVFFLFYEVLRLVVCVT